VFTYPRPESPPAPPMWMGVVSGLSLLGALVALAFHDYQIAGVGIILCNGVFLLLAVHRRRERRRQVGRTSGQRIAMIHAMSLFGGLSAASVVLGVCWGAGLVTWHVAALVGLTLVTASGWRLRQLSRNAVAQARRSAQTLDDA
jgi:hypothetical protein